MGGASSRKLSLGGDSYPLQGTLSFSLGIGLLPHRLGVHHKTTIYILCSITWDHWRHSIVAPWPLLDRHFGPVLRRH
jgi:hypothetical protein